MMILPRVRPAPLTNLKKFLVLSCLLIAAVAAIGLTLPRHNASAAATPTHIQSKSNEIRTGTTNNVAFNSTTAGNLIVVTMMWNNTDSVLLSDSSGNGYAAATARTTWGSNWSQQTFYAKNIVGGADTVTATFGTAINSFGIAYVHEYSGIDKVSPLDVSKSATGTASAMTSGDVTTTNAADLLYAAGGSRNTVTAAGSGYTTRLSTYGNRTMDRSVTSAGTYAATATQNSNGWVIELVAFKADDNGPAPDLIAPTTPANLTATAISASQVNLAWNASTDNIAVTGYRVFRDGTQIATTTTPSYQNTGLTGGTSYIYSVSAYDAAGNASPQSPTATATTSAPDTIAPTVSVTAPLPGTSIQGIVTVTADASDDTAVAGVRFIVDGVNVGTEDTSDPYAYQWDTRQVSNGTHTVTARARDAAGNTTTATTVSVNVANSSYFQNEILATGLSLPTAMRFLPDGRMLVAELKGRIKIVEAPYTSVNSVPFLQIANVPSAGFYQGIYDFILDPDFATNHYYYVFYTMTTPRHDRLSRFTANSDFTGTVANSEFVLYEDTQDANQEHHGGALAFANDGKLLFTTGEHFSTQNSQNLTNPRGKLHRINKDGTVPTDNPFYDGAGSNYDSIYSYGLRNPFRMFYDSPTGRIFIGDVGGNTNATSQEEINLGAAGANFGWPNSEGACSSPCTSPLFNYPHAGRDASVTGGFVYHGTQFPASYQGNYFYADYGQNWIRRLTFGANGAVTGDYPFEPIDGSKDGPYGDIVYLTEGPDGSLYYIDLGFDDLSATSGISKVRRIRYNETNQAPIAHAAATPITGLAPLTVDFSSAGSSDPESQPISYVWDFGDGTANSTSANPSHTFAEAGQYQVRLSVSDGTHITLATPLTITAGNAPVVNITSPVTDSTFRAGDTISFGGTATDTEDGTMPASAYAWTIDFLHEGHIHPVQTQVGVTSGTFTIPTEGHDYAGNTRYRIRLTATDADGLSSTTTTTVYPEKVVLSFNTVPSGRTLYLDGIAKTTPFTYDTLIGFHHTIEARNQASGGITYTFDNWSDSTAQLHELVVPAADQSYTATYTSVTAPTGLVGAWNFNEGTGTNITDVSGYGNNGTLSGAAATWSTSGKYGNALSLSGTASGYAIVPHSASLNLTGSHTFEAWVKPTTVSGYQTILIKELTNGCTYWLQLNGNRISSGFHNGTSCNDRLSATTTIAANQWSHVAAVFDDAANNYKIYLNGNLISTITENGSPAGSSNPLVFGQTGWAGGNYERWHGLLDDIRIYNRALTASELQADMNTAL